MLLVAAALLIVFLAENARIPVDDPNTHLELTMIHEVMVLDHSGPDLAMIQYAAAEALGARRAAGRHSRAGAERTAGLDLLAGSAGMMAAGRGGRRDRVDDGPPAAGARAAVPRGGLGAVDPGPGAGDEVTR